MMGHFNASLPPSFRVVDTKDKETNNDNTKDKRTTKKGRATRRRRSVRS